MAGDVDKEDVGIGMSGTKEEGTDEAHEEGVPGPTGPYIHQRHVVGMDGDLCVPEVGKPCEDRREEGQKLPEVDVEDLLEREPRDGAEGGQWKREPPVAEDTADPQR